MENKANISVIIPTIGRKKRLLNCLHSLLHQSILPKEIIIVNNTSFIQATTTKKIIKKYLQNDKSDYSEIKIRYILEPKTGVAFARNTGIKATKYNLLAFIDDDCIAGKNWIKQILKSSRQDCKKIIQGKSLNGLPNNIYACIEHFTTESFFRSQIFKSGQGVILANYLDTKNFAGKKSLFKKNFYFDTRFSKIFEDIDFSLKAKEKGIRIVYNPDMIVQHFARISFLDHFKREFNKGRDFFRFYNKWQDENVFVKPELLNILNKIRETKREKTENILKKKILTNKNLLFQFFFYFFVYLDKFIIRSGYLFEKLKIYKLSNKIKKTISQKGFCLGFWIANFQRLFL